MSQLFNFLYFDVSTLFLSNQMYKLFEFFDLSVSTLFLFNQLSKLFIFPILMSQLYFYSIQSSASLQIKAY